MNEFVEIEDYILLESDDGELSLVLDSIQFKGVDILKLGLALENDEVLIFPVRGSGHKNIKIKVGEINASKIQTKEKIILSLIDISNGFEGIAEIKINK
jgi:hypothetical protein